MYDVMLCNEGKMSMYDVMWCNEGEMLMYDVMFLLSMETDVADLHAINQEAIILHLTTERFVTFASIVHGLAMFDSWLVCSLHVWY